MSRETPVLAVQSDPGFPNPFQTPLKAGTFMRGLTSNARGACLIQPIDDDVFHRIQVGLGQSLLGQQAFGIQRAHRFVGLDFAIHHRLREFGFVPFVVAMPAIAPHVDEHIALELLAETDRQFGGPYHGFGIVAIHMENGSLDHLGHIGWVGCEPALPRGGGETNLVVHDDVDCSAGAETGEFRQIQRL